MEHGFARYDKCSQCFVESNNKNFEAFNDNIRANCVSKNRKQMLEELNKITFVNARDRVFMVSKIAERADYIDIFISISEEERTKFVVQLLDEPFSFLWQMLLEWI